MSEDHKPNVVSQQHCASPHWARIVREFLDMDFLCDVLGVMDQFRGLRALPVLRTSLDFFLREYVKYTV
jgi:hypothetical protein